jgi:hypothetical protein
MNKLTRFTVKLRTLKGLEKHTEKFGIRPDVETRAAFSKKVKLPDFDRIIFQSKKQMVEYDYEGYEWKGPKLVLYLGDRTRMTL